ncbi:MAG: hypothetical protein AAF648_17130, partial [Pseudomonadota bacterium]
ADQYSPPGICSQSERFFSNTETDFEIHPVIGMSGVLQGPNPRTRLLVVGLNPRCGAPTMLRALDAVERFGFTNERLIDQSFSTELQRAAEASGFLSRNAAALMRSIYDRPTPSVLVVPRHQAWLYACAAHGMAGTSAIATVIEWRESAWRARIAQELADDAAAAPAGAVPLLFVWTLLMTREPNRASRLKNAWLATLEEGLLPPGLSSMRPYSWQLSEDEFFEAMRDSTERGALPRHLSPVSYPRVRGRRAGSATLQLVG